MREGGFLVTGDGVIHSRYTVIMIPLVIAGRFISQQCSSLMKHFTTETHFASCFKQRLCFVKQYGRQLAVRVRMSGSASLFDGGIFMFQAFGILFPAKLIIGNDRLCTMIR